MCIKDRIAIPGSRWRFLIRSGRASAYICKEKWPLNLDIAYQSVIRATNTFSSHQLTCSRGSYKLNSQDF